MSLFLENIWISLFGVRWPITVHLLLHCRYFGFIQHCNENPIYVFPEKKLHGLSHNFHIHVSVSDYIFPRSVHIFSCSRIGRPLAQSWEYMNRSQTHECGNWDWGRTIPFLGIVVSNFRYCVFVVYLTLQVHRDVRWVQQNISSWRWILSFHIIWRP